MIPNIYFDKFRPGQWLFIDLPANADFRIRKICCSQNYDYRLVYLDSIKIGFPNKNLYESCIWAGQCDICGRIYWTCDNYNWFHQASTQQKINMGLSYVYDSISKEIIDLIDRSHLPQPGFECIDYTLTSFINYLHDKESSPSTQLHLLSCSRCKYVENILTDKKELTKRTNKKELTQGKPMELKGMINQYIPYLGKASKTVSVKGKSIFTINLANGVTPFIIFFDEVEYASNLYQLTEKPIVSFAWYRPMRVEFDTLSKEMQDHILNGGLLINKLNLTQQLLVDPVEPDWEFDEFQTWCKEYYGRRLNGNFS